MNESGEVLSGPMAGPQTHVESVQREVGAQRCRYLPAHDPAGEDIEDERDVGPPGVRADVGQVGDPQLVGSRGGERSHDEVLRPLGLRTVAEGGAARLVPRDAAQALGAHQPLHGAPCDADTFAVELGVDLPRAVDTQVRLVRGLDVDDELGVPNRPRRWRPGLGRVVAARGDLHAGVFQHGADRLDPDLTPIDHVVAMGVKVGHYLLVGRSSSAAKKAEAVLRM